MHKQEFQDALRLRYGWELARIPCSQCVCGASFSADRAMICHHGGLTFILQNELRDLSFMKCAIIWLLSLPYSHSLARLFFQHLLIAEMMLGQISMPESGCKGIDSLYLWQSLFCGHRLQKYFYYFTVISSRLHWEGPLRC